MMFILNYFGLPCSTGTLYTIYFTVAWEYASSDWSIGEYYIIFSDLNNSVSIPDKNYCL